MKRIIMALCLVAIAMCAQGQTLDVQDRVIVRKKGRIIEEVISKHDSVTDMIYKDLQGRMYPVYKTRNGYLYIWLHDALLGEYRVQVGKLNARKQED